MPDTPRGPTLYVVVVTAPGTEPGPGQPGPVETMTIAFTDAGLEPVPAIGAIITAGSSPLPLPGPVVIVVGGMPPPVMPAPRARRGFAVRGGEGLGALAIGMHAHARAPLEWIGEWLLGELVTLAVESGVPSLLHLLP